MVRQLLGNIRGPQGPPGPEGEVTSQKLNEETEKLSESISQYGLNVKQFGAVADGVADDTQALQDAINEANTTGIRKVFIPPGNYLISDSVVLNGCSLEGLKSNVYGGVNNGVVINAKTKDFSALLQGSVGGANIEYSVNNITVSNALVGFEFTYMVNSQFNNLHSLDCDTGYVFGKPTSVGPMFNIFNNLYTQRCRIGVDIDSDEYFNNNIFNNGYIQGTEYAFKLNANGGYGAVNNTFNNVEFRSPDGRGILLGRSRETDFNKCYFETGGAGVVTATNQIVSYTLNNCVYALFKADNDFNDISYILNDSLGGRVVINGGTVFASTQLNGKFLYSGGSVNPYFSPIEMASPSRTGTVTNFNYYSGEVRDMLHTGKLDRFVSLNPNKVEIPPDTIFKVSDFTVNKNTENIDGSEIKLTKGYWMINVNIKFNMTVFDISKYLYIRKNGSNILINLHALNTEEKTLRNLSVHTTEYFNGDDILEIVLYHNGTSTPIEINGSSQSYIRLKYLG